MHGEQQLAQNPEQPHVQITEAIREWDYGDYEGLKTAEIHEQRRMQGLSEAWDIWKDGCPGGEYVSSQRPHGPQLLRAFVAQIARRSHETSRRPNPGSARSISPASFRR
jgi:probable phosphoglycerate mutase